MTTRTGEDLRQRIAELTDRMGDAARRADWGEVQRLMTERGAMLNSGPGTDEFTILNIVQSDRSVVELARIERNNIRAELEKINRGRRAVSAYEES